MGGESSWLVSSRSVAEISGAEKGGMCVLLSDKFIVDSGEGVDISHHASGAMDN